MTTALITVWAVGWLVSGVMFARVVYSDSIERSEVGALVIGMMIGVLWPIILVASVSCWAFDRTAPVLRRTIFRGIR